MRWKNFSSISLFFLLFLSLDVFSAECRIHRDISTAPISWNNGDSTKVAQESKFNPELCSVPKGSVITSARISYAYESNASVLVDGLIFGNYGVVISANDITVESPETGVWEKGLQHISKDSPDAINAFNGLDLHNLSFNVSGRLTNSYGTECTHEQPYFCENYLKAGYTLIIEYTDPAARPMKPSSVSAVLKHHKIAVFWSKVSDATYYESQVSLDGGYFLNTETYYQPQTAAIYKDLAPHDYQYRVRACNDNGCSYWTKSNIITVLPSPETVTVTIYNGNDVTISWSEVPGAIHYNREVKINGGRWLNRKTIIHPETSITFNNQKSRSYEYRVRACNTDGCSDWTLSEAISVLPAPESVTATVGGYGHNDVTIAWSEVPYATHYNREVRINGGRWKNRTFYYQPQTSVVFKNQKPRSYEYRVRACIDYVCSEWKKSDKIAVHY